MDFISNFILQNAELAPWLIFFFLLLAGFNIPISEDIMCFIAATLAQKFPHLWGYYFLSVFAGAYISDIMCFFLGKFLGPKLWKLPFFSKDKLEDKLTRMHQFFEKYGMVILIPGRFIPFGVRNAMFLSAGLGQMKNWSFISVDFIAVLLSTGGYFALYYNYGAQMIDVIKSSNQVVFAIFAVLVIVWLLRKKFAQKNQS